MAQIGKSLPAQKGLTALLLGAFLALVSTFTSAAVAQQPAQPQTPTATADDVVIPGFWDPKRRMEKPPSNGVTIRFLTSPDFPPFNYQNGGGELVGFNIDLAQALCKELEVACTIQARGWEALLPALRDNLGDAVISGFSSAKDIREQADLSDIFFKTPARFAARTDDSLTTTGAEDLRGKTIGVIKNTSHAAFLDLYYDSAKVIRVATQKELQQLLLFKKAELVFGDGVQLALWLNSAEANECCAFKGGPYLETHFFGEGQVIAVRKGQNQLRRLLNFGLQRLYEKGMYSELYLKWFPVSVY